jgi:hypothetical protein
MDFVPMWRICVEWCCHRLFQNTVLLFACRNWRNTTENLSGNGLLVENRIRSFPNTKQESSPVSRYIWTKVLDIHINIFTDAHTHTHTNVILQTWGLKRKFYMGQTDRRMSFQAIRKALHIKLITALRMFNAFNNKVTVCYSYWTLELCCVVFSPDLGCTLPSRDSKMFRIGERVIQNELLGHVFETMA